MARQMGFALAIVLSLAAVAGVRAQSEQQPPSTQTTAKPGQKPEGHRGPPWWKDEKFRAEVGFSLEQAAEIDKIHIDYLQKAVPLRGEVNDLDKTLEKMIKARDTDLAVFTHTVEKVEARRAELNKLRTVMLYRISRVLTPEQNARFRPAYERRDAERKKTDGKGRK
jgi:Spy/CpxP family protein refolding chaperone